MNTSFHNTIKSNGQMLIQYETNAKLQEERVLEIFRLNSGRSLATHEAHLIYITKWDGLRNDKLHTPHDSIKRAITNLTGAGKLIKGSKDEMVAGVYGKPVFTWRIKE